MVCGGLALLELLINTLTLSRHARLRLNFGTLVLIGLARTGPCWHYKSFSALGLLVEKTCLYTALIESRRQCFSMHQIARSGTSYINTRFLVNWLDSLRRPDSADHL